ncbi:uncharacterized protein LOC120732076 [Simochromis diagramma]|uniref:uncharacterized protein LOC120732076 n=1 Tax=Simochromis diagramma TaxID=43689 RepID=UPI001A7F00CC|nr:uncharacterized protein LOC120732076 [Simochromis diagramma]XP_039885357.1 uncharacterized protein LOC120732076 [Simochromis diagramma]XP_039885358.1 uncharacterized protein LOC120732076 [Simochromis diagramma]
MDGSGDGSQNNRNGRQVNPEMFPRGDQEPAYEPVGGFWGLLERLYVSLYDILFWRLTELLDELEDRYDVFYIDFHNVNDGNVNNVNNHNINVRDNNANVDNNELHDDHNAVVVVGIENDDSDEAFEDCEDVHPYVPEEDPQPGVSRKRSREMDVEDVEANKRIRWSEEFSDDDSDFISACDTDSEGCPHLGNIADEVPLSVGSTKRSRKEDGDEEEPNSKKSRLANSDSGPAQLCMITLRAVVMKSLKMPMKSLTTMKPEARGKGPEMIWRKKRNTCAFANFGGVQMSPPAPVMTTNTISTGFFCILLVG